MVCQKETRVVLYGLIAFIIEAITVIPVVFLHKKTFTEIPAQSEDQLSE
jgi:hypothetical protein